MAMEINDADLRVTVLGPLHLRIGGVEHSPGAFKPRQVLALLLLNSNRMVPISEFMHELWDQEPPRSALTTLQTYILHLRKFLAGALGIPQSVVGRTLLVTMRGGYLFRLKPSQLDLDVFTQLTARGRQAMAAGEAALAAKLFRGALETWQGHALVDVPAGPVIEPRVRGLQEARLVTHEQCIESELLAGHHREVLSELAALVAEHRYNETLHGHFMLALHRSGRRSEALGAYQRLRTTLIDEVGLEPSSELRKLHQAMLSDVDSAPAGFGKLTLAG
ncbi:BTAD domain-containing putative transcriptional regulator [Amycolatopsis sp. NPDC059090]|uniref:AfsR/SARP family transcriptional regulator n=1 Tax=unclassified Amycolatopsis TaxID=2618356 RepID=UPI00366EA658